MTLAALAREQRKVRRLTGVEDPDADLPDLPADVEVVEPRVSRETVRRDPARR